jgi:TolB protein
MKTHIVIATAILAAAALPWGFAAAPAAVPAPQQDVTMTIREGMPAINLALPKFTAGPGAEAAADEIYKILLADVKYSRIFSPLPESYYSYIRPLDPSNIFFKDWESINANNLLVGSVSVEAGGDVGFEWKLYDVKPGQPMKGKSYKARKEDLRFMVHKAADDITAIWGNKPVFATKVAFVSNRDGNDELYLMDYDGAAQTRLTFNNVIDYSPALSPDGRLIAYTSYQNLTAGLYILQVYEGRRIAVSVKGGNFSPAWSADGKKLAFSSSMDGNQEIYVADVDDEALKRGSFRIKRLTFNNAIDGSPTWSPTGRELAFVSDRGGTPQIYTMDAEGSNVQRVSFGGSSWHDAPAWSPAGDRIVYVARVDEIFDLYVLDLMSKRISKLTESSARNESPTWSPDGRHILFTSNMKGGFQIFTIDYDGANLRQLTTKGQNKLPAWAN